MATWNITNCKYTNAVSGVTDKSKIIIGSFYKVTSDEGAVAEGYVDILASNFSNWKDWNTVTESEVIQWTKDALGEDGVTKIEQSVNDMGGFGVPWA
jgi:hypothetical protein